MRRRDPDRIFFYAFKRLPLLFASISKGEIDFIMDLTLGYNGNSRGEER